VNESVCELPLGAFMIWTGKTLNLRTAVAILYKQYSFFIRVVFEVFSKTETTHILFQKIMLAITCADYPL
jgi:hypothetical protein